jgi:hypothetical protein
MIPSPTAVTKLAKAAGTSAGVANFGESFNLNEAPTTAWGDAFEDIFRGFH